MISLLRTPSRSQASTLKELTFDGSYGVRPTRVGSWWVHERLRLGR